MEECDRCDYHAHRQCEMGVVLGLLEIALRSEDLPPLLAKVLSANLLTFFVPQFRDLENWDVEIV